MRRVKEMAKRGIPPAPHQFDDLPKTWRVRYVMWRYGHRIAYCALGVGLLLALAWSGTLYSRVNDQQHEIQRGRLITVKTICGALNSNADATNAQTLYIRGLIVTGAKSSQVFEPIYRQYGAPPYAERVRQAEHQAEGLNRLQVKRVDCASLVRQIAVQLGH